MRRPQPATGRWLQRSGSILIGVAILVFGIATVHADALSELASFSVFDRVDLAQLAGGGVKTLRGVKMSTSRYLSVQSCYIVAGSPAQHAAAMRKWTPINHPELGVYLHSDIGGSPGEGSFSRLQQAPANNAVRALIAATQKLSPELQVSTDEAKKLSAANTGSGISPAWAEILAGRARAFLSGGTAAQPPYNHTGQPIKPNEEVNGLLRQQEKIRKHFGGLLETTGIGRGSAGSKPDLYWELLEVDDLGVLTLGASYSRAGGNGTYQAADTLYYASGGYYVTITLHQMWPIDVGGKQSTLVWRGDMVSSAALASLRGIEKLASESAMMKDIGKAITAFRRDTGGR